MVREAGGELRENSVTKTKRRQHVKDTGVSNSTKGSRKVKEDKDEV